MQEEYSQNTLLDIFTTLRKHLFGMSVIFVIIVSIVIILTFIQTPIYEVVSSVMVKYGRGYVYRSIERSVNQLEKGDIKPLYIYNGVEVINTEIEIFRSKELAAKVIEAMGVEQLFPKLAAKVEDRGRLLTMALNRFGKKLKVWHIKESSVISVSFQHQDPAIAVQAVNLLTEQFKERHLQIFKNPQSLFLEKQAAIYLQQLQDAENAFKVYKQDNRIFSLEHQQKILMQQYVDVQTLLIEGSGQLKEWEGKVSSLEKELETVPGNVLQLKESITNINTMSEGGARSGLLKLQLEEQQLMEKYPEGHRLIVAVRKEIEIIKEFIASLPESSNQKVRTGRNYVFQEMRIILGTTKAGYAAQKEKNKELQRQLDRLETQLQKLTAQESKFRELALQVETSELTYKSFVGKLEDSRIQDAMDRQKMVNVVVIEKPMMPTKPIKPKKKLNILVGIILGAAGSLFYALFLENVMARKT